MRILFIGGDKRMDYAAEKLSAQYTAVRTRSDQCPLPEEKFGAIVLPLPLTKNGLEIFAPLSDKPVGFDIITGYADKNAAVFAGGECPALTGLCAENGYKLVNYFAEESLTLKNAALTAEAACALLSQSTDGALLGSSALITGYGRISRLLAYRLRANGSLVTIAARRPEQRTAAELDGFSAIHTELIGDTVSRFDFVANTVPHALFAEKDFSGMKRSAVFIELATLPGQPSKPLAENSGIQYIYAPGLPGKHSPRAAGEAIAETISAMLK